MPAPDWLDLEWKESRHREAPDEEVWAAKVTKARTLSLSYDEERIPFTLGATAEMNSQGSSYVKAVAGPASQPERSNTRVYPGEYVIGANGKAWAVPKIVYLYTYREV